MPKIQLVEVKSVSSQDDKHPAENLLTYSQNKKWLCAPSVSSSTIEVTFKLVQSVVISGVDIGNYGSAFVSVLVSRIGCSDFKQLLPNSAFMSVLDSNAGQNKTTVRMFTKDDFIAETRDGRWGQVRVVCIQPFNRRRQFGLSFIRVSSLDDEKPKTFLDSNAVQRFKTQVQGSRLNFGKDLKLQKSKLSRSDFLHASSVQESSVQETSVQETKSLKVLKRDDEIRALFESMVVSYLENLHLTREDLKTIKAVEIREQFEDFQNQRLVFGNMEHFYEILGKYVNCLNSREKHDEPSSSKVSPVHQSTKINGKWENSDTTVLETSAELCERENEWDSAICKKGDNDASTMISTSRCIVNSQSSTKSNCQVNSKTFNSKSKNNGAQTPTKSLNCWNKNGAPKYNNVVNQINEQDINLNLKHLDLKPSNRRNCLSMEDAGARNQTTFSTTKESEAMLGGSRAGSSHDFNTPNFELNTRLESSDDEFKEIEFVYTDNNKEATEVCRQKRLSNFSNESPSLKRKHSETRETYSKRPVAQNSSPTAALSMDDLVECPTCHVYFGVSDIQCHSEECGPSTSHGRGHKETCPICGTLVPAETAVDHAAKCALERFG